MFSEHFNIMQLLFREEKVVGIFEPEEIGAAYSYLTHAVARLEMLPNSYNRKGTFQSVHTWIVPKAVPVEKAAFYPKAVNGWAAACPTCKLISKSLCNKLLYERTYERVICQNPFPLLKILN